MKNESVIVSVRKTFNGGENPKRLMRPLHYFCFILTWLLLGRLAFVSDEVSNNGRFEAERPPNFGWATFGWAIFNLCPLCIALDLV